MAKVFVPARAITARRLHRCDPVPDDLARLWFDVPVGRIVVVRHGQASFGSEDYDLLSELGWKQAQETGRELRARGIEPDLVLTGQLRRHAETLVGLAQGAGWSDCQRLVCGEWDEIDHGAVMEAFGESPIQADPRRFQSAYERSLALWMESGVAVGDESFLDFASRVTHGLHRAADEAGPGRTVVVVTSGGPIGVVCAALMQQGFLDQDRAAWVRWNAMVINCAISTIIVGGTGQRLLTFNEHHHLASAGVTYR